MGLKLNWLRVYKERSCEVVEITKEKAEDKPCLSGADNLCPDYDDECIDVEDFKWCCISMVPIIAYKNCPMVSLL